MVFANVIFHAFEAAYFSWAILPLAVFVLVAETGILWLFNRQSPRGQLIGCVLLMNCVSYLLGYAISPMLYVESGLVVNEPDEHGYGILERGPNWEELARYSFLQAAVVSAMIEIAAVLPFQKWLSLRRVAGPIILGNALTYAAFYLGFSILFMST